MMRYVVFRARPAAVVFCCLALCLCVAAFAKNNNTVPVSTGDHPYPVYSVEIGEKKVALGINCAWDNADIPILLQALEERGISATFFVAGSWCSQYPESVKQIYDAGHEVGSHSNTHADMTVLSREEILEEIRSSSEKIEAITGQRPLVFRPPSGAYNELVVRTIREEGMTPIQWDCDSVDYQQQSPAQMQERVLKTMRNGSIFLFHSGGKGTAEALPGILDEIQLRGYSFVTVSELVYPEPYTVDFEGRQHKS